MEVFHDTFAAMNTRLSLLAPGLREADGARLSRLLRAALTLQERVMSRFDPDAELAKVNASAGERPVRVSPSLWSILTGCADHWRRTGGAFDIAWRACGVQGAHGGFGHVRLEPRGRTISFDRADVSLDLGGVGKGIALRRIERLLRGRGISRALISFGESSILAIGPRPCGGDWDIAMDAPVEHPPVLSIRDAAISTSGQVAGRAAIVDPADGQSAPGDRLLSVACGCPIDAEVLSTALLARPADRASILARYGPARAIELRLDQSLADPVAWRHG